MIKILLIDDEEPILFFCRRVLETGGYDVTTAKSGREALDLFKSGDFSLVITDFILPDQEAPEIVHALRAMNANIPVITMSGGNMDKISAMEEVDGVKLNGVLAKPFEIQELLDAVKACL